MKDVLKRIAIILVLLIAFVFTISYFSTRFNTKKDEEKNENKVQNEVVNNEKNEEKISDSDEIETYKDEKARCTANLNLRTESNIDSQVIVTIPKNEVIDVTAKIRNGWYKVSYNSKIGFVSGEYINILSEEEKRELIIEKEFSDTFASVNISSSLNIRERANKSSKMVTNVKSNSVLKVLKKMQNGWYMVEGNTVTGYVDGKYIKLLNQDEYKAYSSQTNNLLKPEENIIATYTSTSTYNSNSRYNMHLAADYINGTIIAPGESYSHLKVVHPEGEENKYVASTIFVNNGQTAQASGGGICQTSSTTYAAIVSATEKGINTGLNVTAQAPHSGKVNYVPRKYEATVSSGTQDFCFRNCNSYSIKIITSYNHNTLTVTIVKV